MKIMNVEKRILTEVRMDQLMNLNANENLLIRSEKDGKRCLGYVDLKGQYIVNDEVKSFREYIECDIFAPSYKCNDDFAVHLADVNGYIDNGLVVNLIFEINGINDEEENTYEDDELSLLGLEDLFEENENLYTNCTLVVAKENDTYESIAEKYKIDVNELRKANNDVQLKAKLCILIPKA